MKRVSLRPLLIASLIVASIQVLSPTVRGQQHNAPGATQTSSRQQQHPQQQTGTGRYYALVIGNQAYASLPRLKTAEADARAVDALLREVYGFETKLLLDATRQQIVSAIYSYRQTVEPDANLLIYYAGHGFKDAEEEKAYWLPVDATRDDPSNWIMADEITARVKSIPARHVLVVSDSCYSGTLTGGLFGSLPPLGEREKFLRRMSAGRSRTLMASGGDEPVADGGGGGNHSVFANALLRGLRDMDKDGFTAAEVFRQHVEESVAGRAQQMPEYQTLRNSGHESGDFVFVRLKPNGKRAEVIRDQTPVDASVLEAEHWKTIENSGDPEEYRQYLVKYPNGQFTATAREREKGGIGQDGGASSSTSGATGKPEPKQAEAGGKNDSTPSSASGARPPARRAKQSPTEQSPLDFDAGRERQSQTTRDARTMPTRGEPGRRP